MYFDQDVEKTLWVYFHPDKYFLRVGRGGVGGGRGYNYMETRTHCVERLQAPRHWICFSFIFIPCSTYIIFITHSKKYAYMSNKKCKLQRKSRQPDVDACMSCFNSIRSLSLHAHKLTRVGND